MELRVLRATNIGLIFDLSVRHKGWNAYQTVETCVQGAAIDRVGRKPSSLGKHESALKNKNNALSYIEYLFALTVVSHRAFKNRWIDIAK